MKKLFLFLSAAMLSLGTATAFAQGDESASTAQATENTQDAGTELQTVAATDGSNAAVADVQLEEAVAAEDIVDNNLETDRSSSYSFWIMVGLMLLVLYFFMWRPESKRRKAMQKFREGLKKGDKIITAGGIYGVVKEVKETSLLIEVDSNVTLRIDKSMVVADNSALQQQQQQ